MGERYCDVALPVPLRRLFTYRVPEQFAAGVEAGSRVVVPFRNRVMVGVALATSDSPPETDKVKSVLDVPDVIPALTENVVRLGRWVAEYYLAPPGEVFRAVLPPAVEIRRERHFAITEAGRERWAELAGERRVSPQRRKGSREGREEKPAEEGGAKDPSGLDLTGGGWPDSIEARSEAERTDAAVLGAIAEAGGEITGARLARLVRHDGVEGAIERLMGRKFLEMRETAGRRRSRGQKIVAWKGDAEAASEAENRVRDALLAAGALPVVVAARQAGVSRAVIERLARQGKLESWEEAFGAEPEEIDADEFAPIRELTGGQERVIGEIRGWIAEGVFQTGLLFGATGSGKTEVYLRAVETALALGRGAVLLVPEIALTYGVGRQARARFGDRVAVLHSALPDGERAREWWRIRRGEAPVVVATRLGVFAPVPNLGLVVVDEEQEASYKQEETPRYNGRDTAIMRAKLENAAVVLGSATPSLESYQHARAGKYRLLELGGRVENRPMARVDVVDLRADFEESKRALPVSSAMARGIKECLESGTQALVLINRRGYSWFVLCRACGATIECANCSIALTYHKRRDRLVCHYCGYAIRVPELCPKCRSEHLYYFGEGAERIEEYLRGEFPRARVARLDRDTARSRQDFHRVLGAFARGEIDILVGTQMVAKGHDFQRVTLVGVVGADRALAVPDFRAAERAFQLLTQVAGRAGRGTLPGRVLVESYHPEHYAIQDAARQDYPAFFDQEVRFRRLMHYPPFAALANVVVRDRNLDRVLGWTRALAGYFGHCEAEGLKVLGPAPAPLARLKREHRFQFLLKSPRRSTLVRALGGCVAFCAQKEIPETAVLADVDPVSLM
ncbi:MAG: primosomal protein N' [Acidobacteriota bacterium]|nr:primosomal protein N' [Acidobacteriota bacterium]